MFYLSQSEKKVGVSDHQLAFPTITVCSHPGLKSNLSDSDKAYVERRLSPMKTFPQMWTVWSKFVREGGARRFQPWTFSTLNLIQLHISII